MSEELDKKMSPFGDSSQTLQDRVAETLNLMHDFEPITPTKKGIDALIKKDKSYKSKDERDISMLTNIPQNLAVLIAYSKALDVTEPCSARTAFTEQLQRSASSVKGWRIDRAIEGMKAVRPFSEEEKIKSKFGRLWDGLRGR